MEEYFPLDMSSLHSMLFLSKDICSMIKHNAILWVSIAKRISKRCQACFLEARDSAQYSDCPGYQYWRDSVEVLSAANSLRCQWGISASSRVFVNTGKSTNIMKPAKLQRSASLPSPNLGSQSSSLASRIRTWLSLRAGSDLKNSFVANSRALSRSLVRSATFSTCDRVVEETDQQIREEEDEIDDNPLARNKLPDNGRAHESVAASVCTDDICVGKSSGHGEKSHIKQKSWHYCGRKIPKILDMFLQQEVLSLLGFSSKAPQHAHCVDCYPSTWQDILRLESSHTCFSTASMDGWCANPSTNGGRRPMSRKDVCACRCSSWQEIDAAIWLPSAFLTFPLNSYSASQKADISQLFPYAAWVLLQLWRAAGGNADTASPVRFFATRIARKHIYANCSHSVNNRIDQPVQKVSISDFPSAPLLIVALSFNRNGKLVRVAGVCCGNKRLLEESYCHMFQLER